MFNLSSFFLRVLLAGVVLSAWLAARASGSASLTLSPPSPTVARGASFSVTVNLNADQTTSGLDYYLRALGSGSGLFTITNRNTTGSPYSDLTQSDAAVSTSPNSILQFPRGGGTITGCNNVDLGATTATGSVAPVGTNFVATYTLLVSASAPTGNYTLQTYSDPGFGYSAPALGSTPGDFTSPGNTTVTVTPEPNPAMFAAAGALAFVLRRGARCRRATVRA